MITRRNLLLVRRTRVRAFELSGEQLYMRYIDSLVHGTTAELFEALAAELEDVEEVRLTDSAWLACADLKVRLDPLFAALRARGGRVRMMLAKKRRA